MREKIERWKLELDRLTTKQADINQRIKELRRKIDEAERELQIKENEKIAELVREVLGEASLEKYKDKLMRLNRVEVKKTDTDFEAAETDIEMEQAHADAEFVTAAAEPADYFELPDYHQDGEK